MIAFETNRLTLAFAGVLSLFYSKKTYKKAWLIRQAFL